MIEFLSLNVIFCLFMPSFYFYFKNTYIVPLCKVIALLFFAFLGILRVGKLVFEHAPAHIIAAPAQIINAPAQIITAPAQPPATGAVVYTALLDFHNHEMLEDSRVAPRSVLLCPVPTGF